MTEALPAEAVTDHPALTVSTNAPVDWPSSSSDSRTSTPRDSAVVDSVDWNLVSGSQTPVTPHRSMDELVIFLYCVLTR